MKSSSTRAKVQVVHHNGIDEPDQGIAYFNCSQCLNELPSGQSPREFKRLDVSLTKDGLQVWCVRHGINVDRMELRVKPHNTRKRLAGAARKGQDK